MISDQEEYFIKTIINQDDHRSIRVLIKIIINQDDYLSNRLLILIKKSID